MKLFAVTFLAALLLSGVLPARADDPPPPSRKELMRQFDADGDGKLSREEKAAAKEALAGLKTGKGEAKPGRKAERAGRTGKTGKSPKAARKDASEKPITPPKVRPAKCRGATLLSRFDADGDGALSPEEAARLAEDFRRRYGPRR